MLKEENIGFAQINRKKIISNPSLIKIIRLQKHSVFNMFLCGKPHIFFQYVFE